MKTGSLQVAKSLLSQYVQNLNYDSSLRDMEASYTRLTLKFATSSHGLLLPVEQN